MLNIVIAHKTKNNRTFCIEELFGISDIANRARFVIATDDDGMAEILKIRNQLPYIKQGDKFSTSMIPLIVEHYLKYQEDLE
jgi:hypothetical protein